MDTLTVVFWLYIIDWFITHKDSSKQAQVKTAYTDMGGGGDDKTDLFYWHILIIDFWPEIITN